MSYTLRKIYKDNLQININLGNQYSVVDRETNSEKFSETFKIVFDYEHVADLDTSSNYETKNCYAFIINEGGKEIYSLFKKDFNYIMTESGKTFSHLTYK